MTGILDPSCWRLTGPGVSYSLSGFGVHDWEGGRCLPTNEDGEAAVVPHEIACTVGFVQCFLFRLCFPCQAFREPWPAPALLASSSSADLVPPWVLERLVSCPCLFRASALPDACCLSLRDYCLSGLLVFGFSVPPGCGPYGPFGLVPPFPVRVRLGLGPPMPEFVPGCKRPGAGSERGRGTSVALGYPPIPATKALLREDCPPDGKGCCLYCPFVGERPRFAMLFLHRAHALKPLLLQDGDVRERGTSVAQGCSPSPPAPTPLDRCPGLPLLGFPGFVSAVGCGPRLAPSCTLWHGDTGCDCCVEAVQGSLPPLSHPTGFGAIAGQLLAFLAGALEPLARATFGLFAASVLAVLLRALSAKILPLRRSLRPFSSVRACAPALVLGCVASPTRPLLAWAADPPSARRGAVSRSSPSPAFWQKCALALLVYHLPVCIWAAPPGVSDLDTLAEDLASLVPDAWPATEGLSTAGAVASSGDAGGETRSLADIEADMRHAARFQDYVLRAPLLDAPHRPAPLPPEARPQAAPTSAPGIFHVMAPHYQPTAIVLELPRPCTVGMVTDMARGSLGHLQLEFAQDVIPTVPQVGELYGALLVVPSWLQAADMEAVVWDFRALDGPMYSGFAWSTMSHGDCAREAARHGFNAWSAFAFGNTYPVPPGATFLATPGGVIQFRPPGEAPLWYGTLLSRLNTRTPWVREVTLPHNRSDRPICVLHHDSLTLYSRARFPEGRPRETIAGFVDRQEHTAIFSTPLGHGCGHLSHHGVECRDVLAVFPLRPTPTRQGRLVFLDPRQINYPLTFLYSEDGRILPRDLVRFLGVCPPPLHHVSFLPEPEFEGYILAQEGDTIVIGFRADADSSAEDAPTDSEDLGQDEAEQVESEVDPQDDPVGRPADVAGHADATPLRARSRPPHHAAEADTEEPATDARVLRRDAQHGRIPGEPPPGRPDTEGHVGLTRIIAHTFGFWAGQAGVPPPRLAVPRPQVAPVPGLPPGFMRVRFLLFPPEYTPELVEAVLPIGSSVDEALHLIAAGRSATRQEAFPILVPAHPQPLAGLAVGVALPAWCQDRYVIMDCTRVNGTLFCALCSDVTNRASLLAVAGLAPGVGFEVFVHEREWALNDHDAIGVHSGYCVTFVPPQHPPFVVAHLADMLHDPLAWNPAAELPGLHGRWVNLLTDDEPCQVLPSPQRVLPARVEFAALLDYTLDRLVLQPAHPPIRDHFDRGILSDNVIIVSQQVARDEEHILYVLDMRPVLCGLTWGVARRGRVRVRPILDRFFGVCPEGYQAVMRGGRTDPGGYPECLLVQPGQVLSIHFVVAPQEGEMGIADTDADESSDTSDGGSEASSHEPASGSADVPSQPPPPPGRPGPSASEFLQGPTGEGTRSRSPRRSAKSCGSSAFLRAFFVRPACFQIVAMWCWVSCQYVLASGPPGLTSSLLVAGLCCHFTRRLSVAHTWPPANRLAAPLCPARFAGAGRQSRLGKNVGPACRRCLLVLGLALCCQPGQAMQLPSRLPDPPLSLPEGSLTKPARLPPCQRPLPTPCRAPRIGLDAARVGPAGDSTPCWHPASLAIDAPAVFPKHRDTLLELAAADARCYAFALAAAYLEVLFVHHASVPGCVEARAVPREEGIFPVGSGNRSPLPRVLCLEGLLRGDARLGRCSLPTSPQTVHAEEATGHPKAVPAPARSLPPPQPPFGVPGSPVWTEQLAGTSLMPGPSLQVGGVQLPFSLSQLAAIFAPGAAMLDAAQAAAFCPALARCCWLDVVNELAQASVTCGTATLVCYTDGSYTEGNGAAPLCGWACVLFQPSTRAIWFVNGALPAYLAEAGFCASPFQGEVAGLLAAALVTAAVFPHSVVHFLSDCTSALSIAEGTCAYAPGTLSQAMRHAHWFRSVLVGHSDTYGHIRGHRGHVGNELADLLAKTASRHSQASCGLLASRPLLEQWLRAGAPYLPWAGVAYARARGDQTLPPAERVGLGDDTYHAGLQPNQLLAPFLPEGSFTAAPVAAASPQTAPGSEDPLCSVLRLTVATFNTLSLGPSAEADAGLMRDIEGLAYRPGRAPLLAAQLLSHGIQAVCLQETRAEEGFTKVGGFLRYASGAVRGQWGTEWWFSDHYTLLQSATGEASICFDERYFAVAHTDARRLFIRFVCRHIRLLFVGVHAPHRATEGCALEEWWLCTITKTLHLGWPDL